jgi:hypothetical protein
MQERLSAMIAGFKLSAGACEELDKAGFTVVPGAVPGPGILPAWPLPTTRQSKVPFLTTSELEVQPRA